jgi:hypothetical protein
MYSRQSGCFLASSRLNQRWPVSRLQEPHFVFIRRMVQAGTMRPIIGSHVEGKEMAARTDEPRARGGRRGVSVKPVRRRIADGVLPVYRCSRIMRLDPHDVDGMFFRSPQLPSARSSTSRWPARGAG